MRKRNFNLSIRLTEEELKKVKRMQQKTNLNMRDFILKYMSDKPIYVKPYGEEIVIQLKAIGNNLNQIAHRVNCLQIRDCSAELDRIYKQIERLMTEWL